MKPTLSNGSQIPNLIFLPAKLKKKLIMNQYPVELISKILFRDEDSM